MMPYKDDSLIVNKRKTSFCKQFWLLCKRAQLYGKRNPMALRALVLVALFNAMLVSSIFHDVGGERFELRPT